MCTQEVRKTQIPTCCDLIEWNLKKKVSHRQKRKLLGLQVFLVEAEFCFAFSQSTNWLGAVRTLHADFVLASVAAVHRQSVEDIVVMLFCHARVRDRELHFTFARRKHPASMLCSDPPPNPAPENMDHKRFPSCITWWNKMYLKTAEYVYAPEYIMWLLLFFCCFFLPFLALSTLPCMQPWPK